MASTADALVSTATGADTLAFTVGDTWTQGRFAYGGLLSAMLLQAQQRAMADPARVPRALAVNFCGAARPGTVTTRAQVERVGINVAHTTARMEQHGGVTCTSSAVFTRARADGMRHDNGVLPSVTPWTELDPADAGPLFPVFTQHLHYRFCGGELPFSGAARAHLLCWLSPRDPAPYDAALVTLLLDALPPAIFARMEAPRPAATTNLAIHYLDMGAALALSPGTPLLADTECLWADAGYAEQRMDLWTPDGAQVALL